MAVMSTAMENLAERDGDGWRIADSARQRRWPIWPERPRPPGSAGLGGPSVDVAVGGSSVVPGRRESLIGTFTVADSGRADSL